MSGRPRYQVPAGYIARGWRFEVEVTTSGQRSLIHQHFGARRFAHNWALAEVKANLNTRSTDPSVQPLPWDLPSLRRAWNHAKNQVAPWWPCCSKEAYASGIADLVTGLHNWSASKNGRRAGRPVGFPRFKARGRDHGRVRFCTGAMRLESDRRHLILPVIGRLRCKENTRSLQRLLAKERARVLSMTLSEHGGRLFVSVSAIVVHTRRGPSEPDARCGIDLGIGREWAVVAHADGTIERIAHPAPWAAVRRESVHALTSALARRYGTIVVEDLDVSAMARGMGRRAFRRTVHQAGIGVVRPVLAYKTRWAGGQLVVADRWFASSRIHHGCGGYHARLRLEDQVWVCPRCGVRVDRNANAALNLRDWTGPVTDRDVQRGGVAAPVPFVGDHGGQACTQVQACEAL
jgi:putative transposase